MKKSEFEKLVKEEGFDEAIHSFYLENDDITNYDSLLQFAYDKLDNDEILFASHILDALIENDYWDGFWRYDYCMGTLEAPTPIRKIEDIEDFLRRKQMGALTINDLLRMLKKEADKGHGDYIVFVTDDEEANGYHALWFQGETPETMIEEQRKYCEEQNCDISLVEKGKNSKSYYIG